VSLNIALVTLCVDGLKHLMGMWN